MRLSNLLWITLGVGLPLSWVFYTGTFCSDDVRYLIGMQSIAEGVPLHVDDAAQRRLLFMLPGALVWAISRSNTATIVFYSAFYLALVGTAGWLGARLGTARTGFMAASATASTALLLENLGTLTPDILCAAWAMASLCTLFLWLSEIETPHPRLLAQRWALATGIFAGLAIATKESGLVLEAIPLGVLGLYWLLGGLPAGRLSHVGLAIVGVLLVFGLEALLFYAFSGVWHSTLQSASAPPDNFRLYLDEQGRSPLRRLRYLVALLDPVTLSLFASALGLSGLAALVLKRGPETRAKHLMAAVLFAFVLLPILYFTIGTTRLSEYLPPVIQARYYIPFVAPSSVLIALALGALLDRLPRADRLRDATAFSLALAFAGWSIWLSYPYRGIAYAARAKESFLAAHRAAAARFPKTPVFDTPSGWTHDYFICKRMLTGADITSTPPLSPFVRVWFQS